MKSVRAKKVTIHMMEMTSQGDRLVDEHEEVEISIYDGWIQIFDRKDHSMFIPAHQVKLIDAQGVYAP